MDIKKLFKENKILWLLAAGILFVIIAIIVSLFTSDKDNSDTVIEQPLQYYEDQTIKVSDSIVESFEEEDSLQVYNVSTDSDIMLVRDFIAKLSLSRFRESNEGNIIYTWIKDNEVVEYDTISNTLFFRFNTPVPIKNNHGYISQDDLSGYFESFILDNISADFEYTNYKTFVEGGYYNVQANRSIDGHPMHLVGLDEHSDYLIFDENGAILEGKILLARRTDEEHFSVDIIHPSNLNSIISNKSYPKDINQGFPSELVKVNTSPSSYGDVNVESLDFPEVTVTTANSIELIYFFGTNTTPRFVPTYYIKGSGEVTYKGIEYSVPMTIYVNAINPDNVLIPTGIEAQ